MRKGLVRGAFAVVAAVWTTSAAPAAAQTFTAQQITMIDAKAKTALASTGAPAASIAVVRGGRIVFAKAYGEQRATQPAQVDAPYAISSVSKQFTAAAILILADQGKLTLDDPIVRFRLS